MTRRGFFQMSEIQSKAPVSTVPKCGACGLYKLCRSPKMEPSGEGRKGILVVAEAPGEEEDKKGIQLIGNSGRYLLEVMARHGINMRQDCWLTNALICRPPNNKIPSAAHVDYCQPNLRKTIQELEPRIIIPLGGTAVRSLISMVWRDHDVGGITRWYGWKIPCQKVNAWICPTFHPSYLLREKNEVLNMMFGRHIKEAVNCHGVPWPESPPDLAKDIELIFNDRRAASVIDQMIARGGEVAFDFEANMLKPDADPFEIVCCSVCWEGKRTIAFPWHGAVIPAMKRLIRSDLRKIASNMKYEERACQKIFGVGVKHWEWCTMTAAHWADNRKGITGLKFQSFIEYGLEGYNETIEPYLKAGDSNSLNRIGEIDLSKLMLYCGMDSLLEFMIARRQRKAGGIDRYKRGA